MEDKQFTTFEEQIRILKKRGMLFPNEETALLAFRRYGYYNIINGYKDAYVVTNGNEEVYKDSISFEQIYSLYRLDRELRIGVMDAMLEVEDCLRNAMAHVLGESFSEQQSAYLDKSRYRPGKRRKNGEYSIDSILRKLNNLTQADDIQPIKHHREAYGNIPPWVLLKGASFGVLVNFLKLFYGPEKAKVISLMLDLPLVLAADDGIKSAFMDTLFLCLDFRNCAAHGGRVYNLNGPSDVRYSTHIHTPANITPAQYRTGVGHHGYMTLIAATNMLDNKEPHRRLIEASINCSESHLKIYPSDKEYLSHFIVTEDK